MGLLSSVVNKVKSVASDIKTVYKGGDVSKNQGKIATGIINVVATVGQSFNPFSPIKPTTNIENKTVKAVADFVVKNPYTSAAVAAAPFTGAAKSVVSAATNTVSKKIVTGAVVAAVVPAAVTSEKVRTGIINTVSSVTPESIISTSANVGQAVQDPSKKTIGDVLKENKSTLVTLGAGAALLTGAKLAAPVIAKTLFDDDKEVTTVNNTLPAAVQDKATTATPINTASLSPSTPPTAQTQQLYASTGNSSQNRRSKRRKAQPPLRVSQKVNVVVSQQQNKRYLNEVHLSKSWG